MTKAQARSLLKKKHKKSYTWEELAEKLTFMARDEIPKGITGQGCYSWYFRGKIPRKWLPFIEVI